MAAPAIPNLGRPIKPKINRGSKAILTIAPTIWAIIGIFIFPFACKTLVHILSKNNPKLNMQTILPYVTTSFIISSEFVDILANAGITNQLIKANNAQRTIASGVPTPA